MSRAAETARRLGRLAATRWGILVVVAAVAGTALRVWVYRSSLGIPDSDEAVVGLMARHFAGGELATYFWGQAYGGSQEVLATVPLFWVAGSSWLTLRLVPIALSALAAVVVWRVGRRTIGEPAALVAGCLSWIWPPFVLYKLTHQWGFYASGTLYTGLLLLVTLRMVERPTKMRVASFGLVVGLALWQSTQLVPIVLPAILWAIWKQPAWLRRIWIAALLAALGSVPALVWNVQHGFGSLSSPIEDTTSYQHRLRIFASPLLPMMLGLRTPFTQEQLVPGLALLVYAVLLGLFAYGAYRARRREASLLYVVAAAFPLLYALAPATLFSQEPKYLVVLSPVLVLLVAQLASTYWRAAALVVVALALSVATLQRMDTYFRTVPVRPPVAPRDLGPLIATLDRHGVDRVYADFWLAYRLMFETDERIVAAQSKLERVGLVDGRMLAARHPFIRRREFERLVEAGRPGFVLFRASVEEGADRSPGPAAEARARQLAALVETLRRHGYERVDVGPFILLAPPRETA